MASFECRLNVILAERRIKKGDFAKDVGISSTTLSALVGEKSLPNFETAYKIAETLNMKIEDIWIKK